MILERNILTECVFAYDRTIEKVEEINDEIQDQMMVADEISQAIAMPNGSSLVDEDDLEAELNMLAQETLEEDMAGQEIDLDMPEVPSRAVPVGGNKVPAKQAAAADPFASLQMEMNM